MFITAITMILLLAFLVRFLIKVPVSINNLNIFSIVVYRDFGLLTAIAIAYWLSNDEIYNSHYIISMIPKEYLKIALLSSFAFMLLFIIYSSFWSLIFKSFNYRVKQGNISVFIQSLKALFYLFLGLVILMYFKNPPVLTNLLQGATALDISILRSESGGNSVFSIVRNSWVPMLAYTLYYLFLENKNNKSLKKYMFASLILAVVCSIWSGAKSPIATLLLGYLGVYFVSSNKKVEYRTIGIISISALSLILFMYYITTLNTDLTIIDNINTAEKRLFAQATGVSYSFYMYPNFLDFKGFSGVSTFLASIMGERFTSVYGDLIDHAVPEFADISGALSSFAAGDAYGLFGWYGIVIGPAFAAFFYSAFYYLGAKGNIRHVFIGIYAVYFGNAYLASSFYSFVWPVGITISLLPFVFIYIISLYKS